jgi:alkylhydroperoxidase/carboxymuconolactone decarboxylase family protein YurZ
MAARKQSSGTPALTARQRAIKARFIRERVSWQPLWDKVLEWDPDFIEAYLNFSAMPWKKSRLSPKVKEFIYIAVDASTTHLYGPGLRRHIQNAFAVGATKEEILEVLQLISVLGIHSCGLGVPMLAEEVARAEAVAAGARAAPVAARPRRASAARAAPLPAAPDRRKARRRPARPVAPRKG